MSFNRKEYMKEYMKEKRATDKSFSERKTRSAQYSNAKRFIREIATNDEIINLIQILKERQDGIEK